MKYVRILCILVLILSMSACFCFADDSDTENVITDEVRQIGTSVEVLSVSSRDTTGFHSVVLGLLGDYNPVVKDYIYQSSNGYTSHSIDIQPDWSWIASAAIFLCIVYCVFRIIGITLGGIK